MKLIKRVFPMSVVLAMLISFGAYADTTVKTNVDDENVKLTVEGTFVNLYVSKNEDKTHVSILIRDVMLLEYVILN